MVRETGIPEEQKWNNTIEEIFHKVKLENDPDTKGWRTDTSEKRTRLSAIHQMTRERKILVNMGKMAMKKEAAQQFITSRRQKVDSGEKGIVQRIMGKIRTHAEITVLASLHPDTIYVGSDTPPTPEGWTRSTIRVTQTDRVVQFMPEWKIEVETHVDTLEVCIWLQEQGFPVTRLEASKKLVADESNVLAAVEFALGMEGMSRDMRCEHCHKETVIQLLVPKKGETRCVKKLLHEMQ